MDNFHYFVTFDTLKDKGPPPFKLDVQTDDKLKEKPE